MYGLTDVDAQAHCCTGNPCHIFRCHLQILGIQIFLLLQSRQQAPQAAWQGAPLRIEVPLPTPVDAASARALADLHGMLFVHVARAAAWVGQPLPLLPRTAAPAAASAAAGPWSLPSTAGAAQRAAAPAPQQAAAGAPAAGQQLPPATAAAQPAAAPQAMHQHQQQAAARPAPRQALQHAGAPLPPAI